MRNSVFVSLSAVCLGGTIALGQPIYVDVTDPIQQGGINTFNASNGQANNWGMGADGDVADTQQWRFRNTGPGAPAWGGTAYTGRFIDGDPAIYTLVSGLEAESSYIVRIYGVFPSNPSSRFGAEVSLDSGATWTMVDNKDWSKITWVDNATELGVPLADQVPNGDTRFYMDIPGVLVTDSSGVGRVDLRLPELISDGSAQDKFNIDGYGVFAAAVPEPTSIALFFLGAGLHMWFGRRK